MSAKTLTLVVNPNAGGKRSAKVVTNVMLSLQNSGYKLDTIITRNAADAENIAAAAAENQLVAVLSGDGIIARAVAGAMKSGSIIAPIPAGRGNDLVRSLGLPTDPVRVAAGIATGTIHEIDLGMVSSRPFLGVASIGFDAMASHYANNAPSILGRFAYVYGAVRAFAGYKRPKIALTIDGNKYYFNGWSIAVGNSGRYGGGMKICPHAKINDGLLDVVTLGRVPRGEFLLMLNKVFRGTHIADPRVKEIPAKTVQISAKDALPIYADGDLISHLPGEITIKPNAVRVLVAKC